MWGYFTGSMTSFCLCAADCTDCFQKETGDLIDLPFQRLRADLFQEATHLRGSPAADEKLFCIHVFIVKWIFPGLEDFMLIYLLIYLSAKE